MPISSLNRTLASVCAAGLLGGCVTVGPTFHRPAAPRSTGYVSAADAPNRGTDLAAQVGDKVVADWWTLFHSPVLDRIMREAIANNRTLAQARARLAEARAAAATEGGLLSIDATADAQRERANLNAFSGGAFGNIGSKLGAGVSFPTNPEYNLYSVGAVVHYNLDLFGGERRRREALAADAAAQARELDAAYLTLTGQVVEQVLIIADATLQLQTLNAIVETDKARLAMLKTARVAGGASDLDVTTAESELAQDATAAPAQAQRLDAARHQLAVLIGKSPAEWSPPAYQAGEGVLPPVVPVALPSILVHNRPDILEAEAQLHAATARIGVAEAARYPNITLNGSFSQDALTPNQFFSPISTSWAVGSGLTAPLFHSGQLKAKQRSAEAHARAALAAYQETVLEAFAQVADILQAVGHDNAAYARQSEVLDAATTRLSVLRKSQGLGGASALQVANAERDQRRALLGQMQQTTNRFADAARLLLATANVPPGVAEGVGHKMDR